MKSSRYLFLVAFAAVLSVVGCKSSTSPNTPSGPTIPKAGTTYTYLEHTADTTGTTITTHDTTIVATVLSSNDTLYGRTDVIKLANGADTLYYAFESNGDVSFYAPSATETISTTTFTVPNPNGWVRLPLSRTGSDTSYTAYDYHTLVAFGSIHDSVDVNGKTSFDGTSSETSPLTLTGSLGTYTISVNAFGPNSIPVTIIRAQTYSFNPQIGGYFFSQKYQYVGNFGTQSVPIKTSTTRTLTAYTLVK